MSENSAAAAISYQCFYAILPTTPYSVVILKIFVFLEGACQDLFDRVRVNKEVAS